MEKWQREVLYRLYDIQNKIGAECDMTAVSIKALLSYKQANQVSSMVLASMFFEKNRAKAEALTDQLELLSRWNFPDKNGRLSDEEKTLNERLEKMAKEKGVEFFFNN